MTGPVLTDPRQLPGVLGMPLSDEQVAAATAPLQPQLIVAGAGTGKTTVMAARVVWLVGSGQVTPAGVLGLTFTNKAAGELRRRIRASLSRLPLDPDASDEDPEILTYHAFAGRMVAEYGPLLGIEPDSRLLSDGQRGRLAHRVACDPLDPSGLQGTPESIAEQIRAMDDTLADLDITPAELVAHDTELLQRLVETQGPRSVVARMVAAAEQRRLVAALTAQFREAKAAGEWLDFADQVRLGSMLAAGVPLVGSQLRDRCTVVLLDEYQDTSRAQRRTLQGLFGGGHPVTAVGDPCQAIYGWRGASVTNIDEFPRHFPRSDGSPAQLFELTVNRRSGAVVLAGANRVSQGLRTFHTVARPLRPAARAGAGGITCALLPSWDQELVWLGDRLAALGARRPWTDVAVLCRDNDQVAAVVAHLRGVGVPAYVSTRRDLLGLPEIATVTSLLRVLADPFANPDLVHHLIGPRWRIGPRDLAILGRRAAQLAREQAEESVNTAAVTETPVSLVAAVHAPGEPPDHQYSAEARRRLAELSAELDRLDRMRHRPVADLVAAAVELLAPSLVPVDSAESPHSLAALVALAQSFRALDGSRGLAEFVAYLDDCARFGATPQDEQVGGGDGIAVMTVHAAKGLEFPVVALPSLSDGSFPQAKGRGRWVTSPRAVPPVPADEPDPARTLGFPGERFTGKDHDEYVAACRFDDRLDEDRLAYVAVTRARESIIASGHWWGPTQSRPRGPSDYLLALRDTALAKSGDVGPWADSAGDRPSDDRVAAQLGITWPAPSVRPDVQRLVRQIDSAAPPAPGNPWQPVVEQIIADRTGPGGFAAAPPPVVSVSGVTAWLRDPGAYAAQLRRPMPRRPSRAATAGTAFHSWMEHRAGQQVLFELAQPGVSPTGEFESLLARTRFADRTPHVVEQRFVLAAGGLVVTGRIDAVFRVNGDPRFEWEVVDWKTGDPNHADPAQLAIYRSAWAAIAGCPIDQVRATFVFLADGTDRSYDDLSDAGSIIARLHPAPAAAGG